MERPAATISFSFERQMEIAEIVIDGDQVAALELLKVLHKELRARGESTCGSIFQPPTGATAIGSADDADTEHHP